jgi:8-oxo-dGTP pyrophosphatase MutT (NUDIX family)
MSSADDGAAPPFLPMVPPAQVSAVAVTSSEESVRTADVQRARLAASVLLIRDDEQGLEIFLQRRAAGMVFAPAVTAFPGGSVDRRDHEGPVPWSGPTAEWWSARFDCEQGQASALVCAAVRETFEECGVLLAGTAGFLADRCEDDLAGVRRRFVEGRQSIRELLEMRGWVLRADMLRPWANWITPEARPRRYDTRFFLAAYPPGQVADSLTTEATTAYWVRPTDALKAADEGSIQLMLPTRRCLEDLADSADVSAAFESAARRPIKPITPVITIRDGVEVVTVP